MIVSGVRLGGWWRRDVRCTDKLGGSLVPKLGRGLDPSPLRHGAYAQSPRPPHSLVSPFIGESLPAQPLPLEVGPDR